MNDFHLKKILYGSTTFLSLLLLWHLASRSLLLNPFILPSPETVAWAFQELLRSPDFWSDALASLRRVLGGFSISVLIGTPLGIFMGSSRKVRWLVDPVFEFFRPIPPIAWIPLAILWFGIGNGPAIFLTMIASFFPIVINSWHAVESIDRKHIDVARSFGANPGMIWREVLIPASLPTILSGYRIGLGLAWMAVMASEMIAAQSGLGYFIHVSQDMLRMDHVLCGMVMIGAIGLALDLLLVRVKIYLVRWN